MLNNAAAPSYFNGGSLTEHKDYRFYVVSRLRQFKMLDDKEISDQEKSQEKVLKEIILENKTAIIIDDKKVLNDILPNINENGNNQAETERLPNVDINKKASFSSSESSNESLKSTKKNEIRLII